MKHYWMGALAGFSLLAASAVAMAAPRDQYHQGGNQGGSNQRGYRGQVRSVAPAYGRSTFTRSVPTYSRSAVIRPAYGRAVYARPSFVRQGFVRPAFLTNHHRGWLSRMSNLRASAYRFGHFYRYSIAARQAELMRLENELANIQANEGWLSTYSEYGDLLRHIIALRGSLGVYAPAPIANLSFAG